jgi:poly(A) polymerase
MVKSMRPLIIPRKGHCISRKQVNTNALRTLHRLRDYGFIAYLVGGCVRDLLLKRTPTDFDIATNATPGQIKRLFRNCRLVGRRFRLAHLHFKDEIIEVSTFRAAAPADEGDTDTEGAGHGKKPLRHHMETEEAGQNKRPPRHLINDDGMVLRDNVFGTPEEDALRRDFTINALAYNITDFTVIDFSTGLSDLRERIIRPIGDPFVRFTEDPVRMLRAVRFAASHGFAIEPATWEVLCELSATITRAAPARLYEEMLKLFTLGTGRPVLGLLYDSGLLAALFPGFSHWLHENSHHLTSVQTNLEYLDELCRRGNFSSPALFMAALFGFSLEEETLLRHRNGIPRQQALDEVCAVFLEEFSRTVSMPARVGDRLRRILAFQPSLHRMPPRRPASLASRPEFADALAYLRLSVETRGENRTVLEWWDAFLSDDPSVVPPEISNNGAPAKRRRRRRRKRPNSVPAAV